MNGGAARRKALLSLSFTALFAALTAAGGFIAIPLPFTPVPIDLKNLFVLLSGLVLGPLPGLGAALLYLIAGAIGAPVFAGGKGGFIHFFGPTGGYLLGYPLSALCAGLLAGPPRVSGPEPSPWRIHAAACAGVLAVYVPGLLRLKAILACSWTEAFTAGLLPFIIGDAVKGAVAARISPRLRRLAAKCFD
ncbi:MAG: biotin transporter BioY [Treponema sp.]|jgi:biotin transport system substrate-specific component|nr:biotin transporter BioY [Treponema sp.]